MGVDLVYAIEFKDRRKKNTWSLVNMIVPIEKYGYNREPNTQYNPNNLSYYENDIDLEFDGKLFHYSYENSTRGIVRDLLSANNWYDVNVDSKGFPDDMSDELKKIYTDEKLGGCWGHSYCTLTELNSIYKDLLNKALNEYTKSQTTQQFDYLDKRLDRLEKIISNTTKIPSLKSFKAKNTFNPDNDEYNESLWDAIYFGKWIYGIGIIADFYTGTWLEYDEVRIVYFFC